MPPPKELLPTCHVDDSHAVHMCQIDDIEGSSPAMMKQFRPPLSNSLDVTDIEGAAVGWKPHLR